MHMANAHGKCSRPNNENMKHKSSINSFPCFEMNNLDLKYVDEFKYLGHIISNNERDDNDVSLAQIF